MLWRTFQRHRMALATALILWAAYSLPVRAQGDLKGGSGLISGSEKSKSSTKPKPARPVRKAPSSASNLKVTPSLTTLAVASEPDATITVESAADAEESLEGKIPTGERLFIFSLPPGRYNVTAELAGYKSAEKVVDIVAGKPASLTLSLSRATYSVTLKTNVNAGEAVYSTGTGPARRAAVQDGRVVLADLSAGKYEVEVKTAEVGYQPARVTFTLPGDTTVEIPLTRLLSTETFSGTWPNLESWSAPAGWRAVDGKLSLGGAGVALPRADSYRYYADFELSSDVRMVNGMAASFVARGADEQHYYLIQLTGAKADEPHVLRGFIINNGVAQRMGSSIPISQAADLLKPDKFFNVGLKMTGYTLEVSVADSDTGQRLSLGRLSDANKSFNLGAVGLAARANEQNEIGRFIVCATACASESPAYGAFQGTVVNAQTSQPLVGAVAQFINEQTGIPVAARADEQGRLSQGLLVPGTYKVRVAAPGFKPQESTQQLFAARASQIMPVPLALQAESPAPEKPAIATTAQPASATPPKAQKSVPAEVKTATGQAASASSGPTPRYTEKVRAVRATNFAQATPATGSLSIITIPQADVLIEPVKGGEAQTTTVPAGQRVVAFNKLHPGSYRIVVMLEGFAPVEVEAFVPATRVVQVEIKLHPK